jgi:diguanylate cyclase (GGDEF)-like protein
MEPMKGREPESLPLAFWRRLWRSPEPEISAAAWSGELQVAMVRLLLLLVLLYIPLREYLPSLAATLVGAPWDLHPMRDPRLALAVAGCGLLGALMVYAAAQRSQRRAWIGFASSVLDVTLVSGMLLVLFLLRHPREVVGNAVIFPVYFLAIGATSLRYDTRICLVTGTLGVLEYAAIVLAAAWRWHLPEASHAALPAAALGPFPWEEQIWRILQLAGATALATAIVSRSRDLRLLSTRDRFTGLLNRTVFNEQLDRDVETARTEAERLTVAMVDIDHFKRFNDTHGHAGGDVALRMVAETLRQSCRATDAVARYGGEEIAIVFTQTTAQGVSEVTERLRQRLADFSHVYQGNRLECTASFGISVCDGRGVTPSAVELIERADRALYRAKATGRNCLVAWTPEFEP